MFCSGCGNGLNDGAAFCSSCGKQHVDRSDGVQGNGESQPNVSELPNSSSKNKKIIGIAAAAVLIVVVLVVALGNSGGLSGTWRCGGTDFECIFEFRGRNFTYSQTTRTFFRCLLFWGVTPNQVVNQRETFRGTFSITDDRIEFVFSDGSIEVMRFRRTENTITIGSSTFTRR